MANPLNLVLPSADDLFTTQEQRDDKDREKVYDIPVDLIDDFPDHPFKVRMDDNMVKLVESVGKYKVLVPAIIRPKDNGRYEMVAGHRRKEATILAGSTTIPCLVRKLTDDEATIIMCDSNLQREHILPSEKAFAYKMKLDAMNRQGQRSDLTLTPLESRFRTNELVGKENGESREQVRRYIRLTELIPEILEMVDNDEIGLRPAVEISYLPKGKQLILLDTMQSEVCTPSHAQAIMLKKKEQSGELTEAEIYSTMSKEKPNQVEQFKIPKEKIKKYFPNDTPKREMEEVIIKALEMYRKRERSRDLER